MKADCAMKKRSHWHSQWNTWPKRDSRRSRGVNMLVIQMPLHFFVLSLSHHLSTDTSGRTIHMDDFENFEFIDYTTSGPWERFITQIEDSLRTWGLTDRSLGVFDPDAIA